jgi:hypothetical protein
MRLAPRLYCARFKLPAHLVPFPLIHLILISGRTTVILVEVKRKKSAEDDRLLPDNLRSRRHHLAHQTILCTIQIARTLIVPFPIIHLILILVNGRTTLIWAMRLAPRLYCGLFKLPTQLVPLPLIHLILVSWRTTLILVEVKRKIPQKTIVYYLIILGQSDTTNITADYIVD